MLTDNQGLGFSLTSNDAVAGDLPGPLYVQEILKDGAAMKNGKLLVGDKYVVVLLRNSNIGSCIS